MASTLQDAICFRCNKYQRPPAVWVHLPPEHQDHGRYEQICQDCFMAITYSEQERKKMSDHDARVEPEFHSTHPYGIPFRGRRGELSVRIKGSEPPSITLIYDHPVLLAAQECERERLCALCRNWDRQGMAAENGVYPFGRKWCGQCLVRLRQTRAWAREQNRKRGG